MKNNYQPAALFTERVPAKHERLDFEIVDAEAEKGAEKIKMVFPDALKVTILRGESGKQENFLLSVNRNREVCHSFENLKNEIVVRYPMLLQSNEIKFFWIDDEEDEITLLNHADYFDYMDSCGAAQKRRIYVKGVNQTQKDATPVEEPSMEDETVPEQESSPLPEDAPVHTNIICDVCDETIRGHRYKCMQCFNYDLCMRCETKFRHKDHLMVRIPTPDVNRRAPFRLFEKLRSYAAEIGAQAGLVDSREDDYENSKRSKRHHRRHSKDREESKERREEKERKERKHRRERSAKTTEERRSAHRRYGHGLGHHFNFSHLINQVIDPANIQSAFLSADAAAAAAAAAAESAQEAARASMANCPLFAAASSSHASSASASASATTSATTRGETTTTTTTTTVTSEQPEGASTPSSTNEAPNAKKAAPSSASTPKTPKSIDVLDLTWLTPTQESIQKINQTFSKILDPLGMNIEIRSNGAAAKPAQTQTPTEEKKDKTTETANTPTTSTPSQTIPVAAGTSSKSTEMDPITELEKKLEAALLAEPFSKLEKQLEKKLEAALLGSEDDDNSSVSSVSMLSDNDESGDSEMPLRKWTLVDIPKDLEEAMLKEAAKIEIAQSVAEAAAQASSPQAAIKTDFEPIAKKNDEPVASTSSSLQAPVTPATPVSVPEVASASSVVSGAKSIDYEQLGKALKEHLEAEKQAASKVISTPRTPVSPPKQITPPPPVLVLPSIHPIPLPAPQPILVPQPIQAPQPSPAPNVIFSHRPHVNHAVHAMMAMGFSNEGGWLSQLLDSVNGDIPRALDLLTPHKINP